MNRPKEASEKPQQEQEEDANLSPSQLLQLAETHLRLRNFSLCRQYALESHQPHDPNSVSNHRHASQLLAISNTLSSPTNFYSILQIDTFCNDFTLIRSQFKRLLSILDPIEEKSPLAKEAVNLIWKAYECLCDPTKKTQFDSKLIGQRRESEHEDGGDEEMGNNFWTFCPYCFYMFQYDRVYEGCCLRCQNQTCRRAFHAVALNSLPKMELDKGQYFSCFGYFPLGFSPENGVGKFDSWSPIVGLFPIADESDESENDHEVNGENVGSNVEGMNVGNGRATKRKSVARNARKLMGKRRRRNEGVAANGIGGFEDEGVDQDSVFEGGHGGDVGVGSGFEQDDMAFFEENGEIFVEFGPDSVL
uniref:J domain-containing protein n=1 Tax=Chenopodium quinoa TaxID=63459 RepID=A0A803KX97_CHEQI